MLLHAHALEELGSLELDEATTHQYLHGNAVRVFNL
jgi:hypothetical protein